MTSRLRSLAVLIAGAVVAFFAGIFLLNALIGFMVGSRETIEVPDLAGLTLAEARSRLSPFGFTVAVKSERPSNLFPMGRIVSQNPKPLARVKMGRRLEVIISSGVDAAVVPSLAGLTLRDANFRLSQEGLEPGGTVSILSDAQPTERIIATSPAAGTPLARGSRVTILASEGRRREAFLMPNLIGHDVDEIATLLRDSGFTIGEVRRERDRTVDDGTIVVQSPAAGSRIYSGGLVDLVVADW